MTKIEFLTKIAQDPRRWRHPVSFLTACVYESRAALAREPSYRKWKREGGPKNWQKLPIAKALRVFERAVRDIVPEAADLHEGLRSAVWKRDFLTHRGSDEHT